jgi:4-hydroxy-tetrahydrodipicolinate reductase
VRTAIVGYGRMGREVELVLGERGHQPVVVHRGEPFPPGCAAGIDFSQASAVVDNVHAALRTGARYVVGTTGWNDHLDDVRRLVEERGGGLVYAPNFSVGVNLFYRIVHDAATRLAGFPEYDPYVLEKHHRQKKDAPSGTAKALAAILQASGGQRRQPVTGQVVALADEAFHVAAVRAGGIVGEHTVGFDSGGDEILLEHRARNRRGFALGAVLAAEWIENRTGFHTFDAVLDSLATG